MKLGLTPTAPDRSPTAPDAIIPYRDWLLELPPAEGDGQDYKTILMICPALHSEAGFRLIDATQARLKPAFIDRGLMIGQFHAFCDEPGVRNSMFHPLRCPIGMLVVRYMTPFDLPFMTRREFLSGYEKRFVGQIPGRLLPMYRSLLRRNGMNDDRPDSPQ